MLSRPRKVISSTEEFIVLTGCRFAGRKKINEGGIKNIFRHGCIGLECNSIY